MRARTGLVVGALLAAAVAAAPDVAPTGADDPGNGADAVVAFVDTGINPYHLAFHSEDPRHLQHPSTYLPGYPADALRLDLTLDAYEWREAVLADCAVWEQVEAGRLYWVPGTRIIGAISFREGLLGACDDPEDASRLVSPPPILDMNGHGTMVASRGAANGYGACASCLVVAVQMPASVSFVSPAGSEEGPLTAVEWAAANNGWIDVQSNSWGPIVPLWDPTARAGLFGTSPETARRIEAAAAVQPGFWASGNGAAFRFGGLGHPTTLMPHLGPSPYIVGGHDSGEVNTWPGFPPHLVGDSCSAWGAHPDSIEEEDEHVSSGTSGATPYVAGSAAQVVRAARAILGDTGRTGIVDGVLASGPAGAVADGPLADGDLTLDELRRLLFTTATARPEAQEEDGPSCIGPYGSSGVKWSSVPEDYPGYLHIGYGAVDRPAVALAVEVLRGTEPMPERPDEDAFFERHEQVRGTLHEVWTTG